ncbi:GNAT family N-acetyltransferase [Capillimicrobium parvum]|uniref:N-acetyltransferase domain-containing protein n=1 Tax=Capillimicrobium parvum TaxID=2884022 RepID=A0A9E7BYY6_9ACTN|nr:GNAT family N-acetyltransferase [Capillimicrobium parvum]UGS34004.1 hypothetical protein DSM104329_00371 [Capillimicrobium parvum]
MALDDATLAARQLDSQFAIMEAVVAGGRGSSAVRPADGVLAILCPCIPGRSMPNSVLYRDPGALTDAVLDELQDVYAAAGVRAWTVWVRPGDGLLAARLGARGHVHDAQPLLMCGELARMDLEPKVRLDLEPSPGWAMLGRLNDRAFGLDGMFEQVLDGVQDPASRLWVARVGGEPAAALLVRVHQGDAEVYCVAVVPEARGRGLSRELLRAALAAARDAGATTTSLESTALGEPVYRSLGYRALGRFGMWERRQA